MKGYMGKMVMVDIGKKTVESRRIPEEWFRDYIGGEGVAVRLFYELMDPKWDAFDEKQPLIFATGPLTGTAAPTSGRWCVVYRSPLSKTLGASNCGGYFAPALKKAGWDLLVVTGKAEKPVFLFIHNDSVQILDASHIWGKGIIETEQMIRDQLGMQDVQIASIGQAGEKQVLFSSIMTDKHRAAGRGGGGALMGSKNLKAIAVKGTLGLSIADSELLKQASSDARKELFSEAFVRDELHPYGTPSFYDSIDGLGILPTKNWQRETFPEAKDKLCYKTYHEKLEVKAYACFGCPIACGRLTKIREGEGPYSGMHGGGPEYEAVAAFGSKTLVDDLTAIAAANHLANDFGLDVISTGQVIATAMEWYEKGILTKKDTGGVELTWGNGEAVVKMVQSIATRDKIGDLLAEGVKRAAEKLGKEAEPAAMHVKGLEMAADGVRASKGEAIVHATGSRGADHLRPYASCIDAFGYRDEELGIVGDIDYLEDGNKGWVKPFQELSMATNLLGVCLFASITLAIKASTWAKLISATVGRKIDKGELLKCAERVINMERFINSSFGFDRKDDTLPARFALNSYFESMGWDLETGLPKPETLEKLGLDWMT